MVDFYRAEQSCDVLEDSMKVDEAGSHYLFPVNSKVKMICESTSASMCNGSAKRQVVYIFIFAELAAGAI